MNIAAAIPTSSRVKPRCLPDRRSARRTVPIMPDTLPSPAAARGSILLVTVLLALVAASIAYVAISGALSIEQQERERREVTSALRDAESRHRRIAAELEVDPTAHLKMVIDGESPRTCGPLEQQGEQRQVGPGEVWPVSCGTPWGYDLGPEGGTLILPADSNGEPLRIVSIIPSPRGPIALQTRYTHGDVRPHLHSDNDLNLTALNLTGIGGLISSSRDIDATGSTLPERTLLAAEGEVLWDSSPGVAAVEGEEARKALGGATAGNSEATHHMIHQIACLSLCLIPGGQVTTTSGDATIPIQASGLRLTPRGGRLDLGYRTSDEDPWQGIGTLEVPHLGIIRVDADLHVTQCLGQEGCGTLTRSVTLLVGSSGEPFDVEISGDLETGEHRVGLSVHGNIRHTGGSLRISTNVTGGELEGAGSLTGSHTLQTPPGPTFELIRDIHAETSPPPYMPGVNVTPSRESSRTLSPQETQALLGGLPEAPARFISVPGAPVVEGVSLTSGTLIVSHAAPETGSGPVTTAQYSTDSGDTWIDATRSGSSIRIPWTAQQGGGALRVRYLNAAGSGPASPTLTVPVE